MSTEVVTSDPTPPVDPAVVAAADPAAVVVADPPAPDPAVVTNDDPPTPTPEPKPHGNKGKQPWYLTRISEETQARQQEERGRIAAEERARNAEEMLARATRTGTDPAPAPRAAPTETDVETRAQQLADQRMAAEKVAGVATAGTNKFADWDAKTNLLAAVGAASADFVLDVIAVDAARAPDILHQLADDPEKAAHLARMSGHGRIRELTRMSMAMEAAAAPKADPVADPAPKPAPKTAQVSRAPAPPPVVEPSASQVVEWRSDKASDQEFSRGWEENQRKRSQRR